MNWNLVQFYETKNFYKKDLAIKKHKADFYFDFNNDGKPLNIKKESKLDKLKKPFKIIDGKKVFQKFHAL